MPRHSGSSSAGEHEQVPGFGDALELMLPRSSKWSPDPATRSLTVRDMRISSGPANDEMRAPIETEIPQ